MGDLQDHARVFLAENVRALETLSIDDVIRFADIIDAARWRRAHVFIVGNGGSASTGSHMACDFMKAAAMKGHPAVRAVCLSDGVPVMTAIANDISYDAIFAEQLRALASPDDVLVVVSGSGRSPNVLRALELAGTMGMQRLGLLGMGGGPAAAMCDPAVIVGSDDYEVIENAHLVVGHLVAARLRDHGAAPMSARTMLVRMDPVHGAPDRQQLRQ